MNLSSPLDCILPCQCDANICNLTKPKQRSSFIDLFSFAKLASVVHTIGFAGSTGTNNKWVNLLSPSVVSEAVLVVLFIRITRKVFCKKKTVPLNKFTIKPSFYVHSNSYIVNNNNNDVNIYVSNGRVVQFNLIFRMRNNDHLWDQDLDDILNSFAFNNSVNTCNDLFTTHANNEIETGEKLVHKRRAPSSRNEFSDPSLLFGIPTACQTALSPENDWQLTNLATTQSSPTSEITFSTEETLLLDGDMSTLVSSTPDIMGNIIQPVDSLSCVESDRYKRAHPV